MSAAAHSPKPVTTPNSIPPTTPNSDAGKMLVRNATTSSAENVR